MLISAFYKNTAASTAVYFAVLLPVLMAGLAVSVEIGLLTFKRQDVQKMADIGAVAALAELQDGGSADAQKMAACTVIEASGASCDVYEVDVFNPPVSGEYSGDDAFVEAVVTHTVAPIFSSLWSKENRLVTARAVVGGSSSQTIGQCCFCSLSETGSGVAEVKGTASLTLNQCGIATNSSSIDALKLNGKVSVTASCIFSKGPILEDLPLGVKLENCSEPIRIESDIVDPYEGEISKLKSEIEWVVNSGSCKANDLDLGNSHVCSTMCGDLGLPCSVFESNSGNANVGISGKVELKSGLYILNGVNLVMNSSQQALTGSEVVILLMNGSRLSVTGGEFGPLIARDSAPFKGILIGEVGTNSVSHKFSGNEASNFSGALYFPSGSLEIAGNTSSQQNLCTQFVADTLTITGNASLAMNNSESCKTGPDGLLQTINLEKTGGAKLYE